MNEDDKNQFQKDVKEFNRFMFKAFFFCIIAILLVLLGFYIARANEPSVNQLSQIGISNSYADA